MPKNLPTELLRTFVAIADTGNFSQAAELVHRTQSAVSMQIKRLEELLEKTLFTRDSRHSSLTADGLTLLGYARRILKLNEEAVSLLTQPELSGWVRIGLPDDYATRFLPEILAGFSRSHPRVQVEVICEPSTQLRQRIKRNELDLAMTTSAVPDEENTLLLSCEAVVWATSEQHLPHEDKPLPLALFPNDCIYRTWAIAALEEAGVEYRIAYSSPSNMGLQSAVIAGLAVTATSLSIIPPGMRQLRPDEGVPLLSNVYFLLHRSPAADNCVVDSLAEHIAKAFGAIGQTSGGVVCNNE
jgi:DNA-binding transcriptional LysR family regulator